VRWKELHNRRNPKIQNRVQGMAVKKLCLAISGHVMPALNVWMRQFRQITHIVT